MRYLDNVRCFLPPLSKLIFPLLLIGSLWSLRIALSAPTAEIVVNSEKDVVAEDGLCTLREALNTVNGQEATNDDCGTSENIPPIITFDADIDTPILLTLTGADDLNISGDLDILTSVVISGNGPDTTIIDGNNASRIFEIISGTVTLTNMTLQNGTATGSDEAHGGAIYHGDQNSTLTLDNVVVQNSSATNSATGRGGGIFAEGNLMVVGSTIRHNQADDSGGGIYQHMGTLTISESNILSNTGSTISESGLGGGIYLHESCLSFSLSSSAIAYNQAYRGGGIANLCDGDGELINSTVSHNQATNGTEGGGVRAGGGLFHSTNNGTIILDFVTVVSNVVTTTNVTGTGGGLATDIGVIEIENSLIVSNSVNGASGGEDCDSSLGGEIVSGDYNLVGEQTGCPVDGLGDQTTADAQLGPLEANGEATLSHPLTAGSPALNVIPQGQNGCSSDITTDQHGRRRPDPSSDRCDVGAYEAAGPPAPDIDVRGSGQLIINGSLIPTTNNDTLFETITLDDPAVVHTFTLRNLGTETLLLTGTPMITLLHNTPFTVTMLPTTTTLLSDSLTTFAIELTGTAAGYFTDTVSIASNDSNENPFTFQIAGTVLKADTVTTITADEPDPTSANQAYEVKVRVSSAAGITPTGSVSIVDDTGASCTPSLIELEEGEGSCPSFRSTIIGSRTLTATYTGDDNFNGSSGTTTHLVDFHDLALTMNARATHDEDCPSTLIFTTLLRNLRDIEASTVTISHTLSGNLHVVSMTLSSNSTYTYSESSTVITGTWDITDLPAGHAANLELVVAGDNPLSDQVFTNTSKIYHADPSDENPLNDVTMAQIRIPPCYDVNLYLPVAVRISSGRTAAPPIYITRQPLVH